MSSVGRVEFAILGRLTEDQFALWEIAGEVAEQLALDEEEAIKEATAAILRLKALGWIDVVVPGDIAGALDQSALETVLLDPRSWTVDDGVPRAHATSTGTDHYFGKQWFEEKEQRADTRHSGRCRQSGLLKW